MSTPSAAFTLADALAEQTCALSPTTATFAGAKGYDHLWDDFGPDGHAARAEVWRAFSRRLDALPPPTDPDDRLAVRVMREHLDERLEFAASADPLLDLNNITCTFQLLAMVFDVADTSSPEGIAAIVERLATMDRAVASYRATLAEGLRTGQVVARRQVLAAIRQGRARSPGRVVAARCAGDARLERVAASADAALVRLTAWLEEVYLPHATETDGVGPERYARAARRHLGMELDAAEAYAWGWEEIRRIEADMRALAGGVPLRELTETLATSPCADVPEPFLDRMRARQDEALRLVDGHFEIPAAIRRIDVRLSPPGNKPGAYYVSPSEDLSRPGTVWYSPGDRTAIPLWPEITTAYHEGFPGHHLQCSLQVLRADRLSRFQRLFAFWPGYAEGWALYAEQLMYELGGFERPEYVLGMHAGQLARACRVVADIGLHLDLPIPSDTDFHPGERWTFGCAVELMRDRALLAPEMAESEVVRYLGWPAQAIAYKIGQRVILELREQWRRRDGGDLRAFHARVLNAGSVGLGTLRDIVTDPPLQ